MIVKVCGMREPDNIRAVEQTGPDWMGFIFFPHSSRHVSLRPAYLPERCKRVGVFVNEVYSSKKYGANYHHFCKGFGFRQTFRFGPRCG